jgi:hypothetical protein
MDSVFKIGPGSFYTNADAVNMWLSGLKVGHPGPRIVLPDCNQVYTYEPDQSETTAEGTVLHAFVSQCRACGAEFITRRGVDRMRRSPAMVRHCPDHKNATRTERGAWMAGAELAALEEQEAGPVQRIGRAQEDVLLALDDLEELFTPVPIDLLIEKAAKKAWRGRSKRDERKKTARTALRSLLRRGLVERSRLSGSLA